MPAPDLTERLAAQIMDRARLLGWPPGTHLRAQELADAFRVSRTPVRAALAALADRGLVEAVAHRGVFLARLDEGAAEEPAGDDPVYLGIAEDRLSGRLPDRVTESALVRRYGVGRPRLVRALARMVEEGWLQRLPGHGWAFQPVLTSGEAYDQGYRTRMIIEPAALREPGFRLEPGRAAALRARQAALVAGGTAGMAPGAVFAANAEFHEALVEACGNPFLLEGVRRVNQLRRLVEYRAQRDPARVERECRDHLRLLDLIEAGEIERAARVLWEHLDRARRAKARVFAPPG